MLGETQKIIDTINQGDQLFDKVEDAHEAVIDAEFLLKTAEIAVQKAQQMNLGVGFDLDEFVLVGNLL